MICGGVSPDTKATTAEVQEMCDKVRAEAEGKINDADVKEFRAVSHRTQVHNHSAVAHCNVKLRLV